MIKMLIGLLQIYNVYSQMLGVGGQRDSNDCLIGAGYSWCESTQSCVRQWETPCVTNCDECLTRQNKGENIACQDVCNMLAIDPMPPILDPLPRPIDPPVNVCPEVMCMMYCEYGNVLDSNGCQMCQCNDILPPPPITDSDCILTQPSCEGYTYVCPKITEMTNCNMGGIDGYTTYRLSLVIKPNMNVKNIYALYGNSNDNSVTYLPPAYQSISEINNIGGVEPFVINLNPDANYDSWLTIGITNGDTNNKLSTIGIDFSSWTSRMGLTIDNGAVFVMDPELNIVNKNEYVIGQLTLLTDSEFTAIVNVQGKTIDTSISKTWQEKNIIFDISSPQNIIPHTIPNNCKTWYDGCNTCMVNNGVLGACTRMMCFREDPPRCISIISGH
jgi:hypothetical protein